MKIYLVGGAVRDKLLGLPIKERDWVVVGATVSDMLALGFKQVGKEFPVFLHPETREEYALARVERKVEPGYKGFQFDASPNVSLEEDLMRRDLTINAMAETLEGTLIDPYHGQRDLKAKLLQHVSEAFSEDPVRILRVGRFLARYAHRGFHISSETIALMRKMVEAGEVDALVPERVWKELERALQEKNPEKFFETLKECLALSILFPDIEPGIPALITAASLTESPLIRFAALMHVSTKKNLQSFSQRYRIPNAYAELATLTALYYQKAMQFKTTTPDEILKLFSAVDIFRRYDRFLQFLTAIQAIAASQTRAFDKHSLKALADAAKEVDIQCFLAENLDGPTFARKLKAARLEKIKNTLASNNAT